MKVCALVQPVQEVQQVFKVKLVHEVRKVILATPVVKVSMVLLDQEEHKVQIVEDESKINLTYFLLYPFFTIYLYRVQKENLVNRD